MNYTSIYDDLMSGGNKLRERVKHVLLSLPPEESAQHKVLEAIGISQRTYTDFMKGKTILHVSSAKRILNWVEKKEKELK